MPFKAYRYRFYPTPEQVQNLAQTFGCVRYVYNRSLRHRQDAWYERQENVSYLQSSALLTEWKKEPECLWLNEVSSVPLQQSLRHLQTGYSHFFKGRAKYPNFKKKDEPQSAEFTTSAFKWDGEALKLAKQSEPLDIRWSRHFVGKPTTVTVSKDTAGRYFVSLLVEEDIALLPLINAAVGVDVGIKDVAVLSTGERTGNPRHTAKYAGALAKAQRRLAKKQKGSNNRCKAKLKVARIHAKIADARRDFTHKLTTTLIRENQVICVESLAVKNMVRHPTLAKSIHDANWGGIGSPIGIQGRMVRAHGGFHRSLVPIKQTLFVLRAYRLYAGFKCPAMDLPGVQYRVRPGRECGPEYPRGGARRA